MGNLLRGHSNVINWTLITKFALIWRLTYFWNGMFWTSQIVILGNINVFMAFFDKTVIKNYMFEQPHNWMAETYCQTYNNLAAILDVILSKYDPGLSSKRF